MINKYLNRVTTQKLLQKIKGPVMLNIGCGTDYKKKWINIDNNSENNIEKLDINLDLRGSLPFNDDSVDFIFNEHFFEHLTPEEAHHTFKKLMNVLKPGGVMRIAMPDLEHVVYSYLNVPIKKDKVIKKFKMDYVKTRAEWINMSFRAWEHKWLYDYEELKRRLEEAGYSNVIRCKLRESKYPELRNLEIRDESFLIVEVIK